MKVNPENVLLEKKIRLTVLRIKMIDFFYQHHTVGHGLGADAICTFFKEVDQATVFRNLKLFCKKEIIEKVSSNFHSPLYRLKLEASSHHHLLICESCGDTAFLKKCFVAQMTSEIKKTGFLLKNHHLELSGLCSGCR